MCYHGNQCLVFFLATATLSAIYQSILGFFLLPSNWLLWTAGIVFCIGTEAVLFWNGIIAVYCTSVQLGLKQRIIGIVCSWIPLVNLFALHSIIQIVQTEVNFETTKAALNKARQQQRICQTKYPILLVHGVFFRDFKFLNYWGRIPAELQKNGAKIYYGNHQSAASIENSARELAARIQTIITTTGCGKVNIIAHSKGGLDCRSAISCQDIAPYVASLTTINTPHRGCGFADYLLKKIPIKIQQNLAHTYNTTLKKLGDTQPDFMAAIQDLTICSCTDFNSQVPNMPGIYYQSVGSKLNYATNGKFPLNYSYHLVKYFDGANDGLVAEQSFVWGEKYTLLTVSGQRGISHGDMIDLNRENISEFDVREFYVQLLADLKNKGL